MLHLQSSNSENPDLRQELREAGSRIAAVARAHQRLYSSKRIDSLDLGTYLTDVCKDLSASIPDCEINISTDEGIIMATDRAVAVALLVNELVSNAIKHAYPGAQCRIWVTLSRSAERTRLTVRDEGVGLPADFDLKTGRRLGMRLVNAFTKQLHGELQIVRRKPGTEFILAIPASARS
jgi:two-component sensor histidine kinase